MFRILNRHNEKSLKRYWKNREYQILSLVPFVVIGLYITKSAVGTDEILLGKMVGIFVLFAYLLILMIQGSYKNQD